MAVVELVVEVFDIVVEEVVYVVQAFEVVPCREAVL